MRFKSVKYYLGRLISDGHKWQNIDINGVEAKPKFYFSQIQFIFILLAFGSLFLLKNGFNKDFIGYIIASLSIFVGLFLTLILTVFDKFQKIDFDKPNLSEKEKTFLIQRKNFFKQFTALTSYSILLSITCIFLLSMSLLTESLNRDVFEFDIIDSIKNIDFKSILLGGYVCTIIIYRLLIVYFFLDFFLMVLYGLTSIYNYIALEFDKKKIP